MKKYARNIKECDDCPLYGNDCPKSDIDGGETPCNFWKGDEVIEPYMYSVAAEIGESAMDKARREQAKRIRDKYSVYDYQVKMLKKFLENNKVYNGNLIYYGRNRNIAIIRYGSKTSGMNVRFDLRDGKFIIPMNVNTHTYYVFYLMSFDFFVGKDYSYRHSILDSLMKRKLQNDDFHRGYKKFENDWNKFKVKYYKEEVIEEMKKLKATDKEMALLTDEVAATQLRNGNLPKDLAWAILQ